MDGIWLFFIVLPAIGGAIAQVQLEPKNATVYHGSEARFNCSLGQPNWVVMSWSLKSSIVLTISKQFGVMTNDDRFAAENRTSDRRTMWEFFIKSVQRNDSGEVICDFQNIGRNVAILSVQESGTVAISGGNVTATEKQQVTFRCLALGWFPEPLVTWTVDGMAVDNYNISTVASNGWFNSTSTLTILANYSVTVECQATVSTMPVPKTSSVFLTVAAEPVEKDLTVVIAVTVSVVAAVLLVVIIVGIIFCCKRRKVTKSGYEEEVRKTRSMNEKKSTSEAPQGKDNLAYLPDGKTGVASSEFNDSGFSQTNSFRTGEMPDVVEFNNQLANGQSHIHETLGTGGGRKHRHATIV